MKQQNGKREDIHAVKAHQNGGQALSNTVKATELARIADALERIAQSLQTLQQITGIQLPANVANEINTTPTSEEKQPEAPAPTEVQEEAPMPAEQQEAPTAVEAQEIIPLEAFRASVIQYARTHEDGKEIIKTVLAEHGASKVSEVAESDRAAVLGKLGVAV